MLKISGGRVVTDKIEDKSVYVDGGVIVAVTNDILPFDEQIDLGGKYLSPGFVDTHVHGGGGYDFLDGTKDAVCGAVGFHLKHGTTSIMPTTCADGFPELISAVSTIAKVAKEEKTDAHIVGIHLEGPYFAPSQAGAQDPERLKTPKREEYERLIEAGGGLVRKVSFAPELDGALEMCEYLTGHGIYSLAGHTDADYDVISDAVKRGLSGVTHLYSAMSTITRKGGFRHLGVVESAYIFDEITAEIIADGCHLPPELLRYIVKFKGVDKVALVTDAMRGAGLADGEWTVIGNAEHGVRCIVEGGVAKMPDRTCFAGSVATADRLVRVMREMAGCSLVDAVNMLSRNPCRAWGVKNKGEIKVGYDADLLVFDDSINIEKIFLSSKGRLKIIENTSN